MSNKPTKVYVASPYTYKGRFPKLLGTYGRWKRFFQIAYYQAVLDSTYNVQCFGPILESHLTVFIGKLFGLSIGKSSGVWADFRVGDLAMVEAMDELWVVMMDGWDQSTGVRAEIRHARSLGKPIKYYDITSSILRETPKGNEVTTYFRNNGAANEQHTCTSSISDVHRSSTGNGGEEVRTGQLEVR